MIKTVSSVPAPADHRASDTSTFDAMIRGAIAERLPIEYVQALIKERNDEIRRLARIAFLEAKKKFQKECPPIRKNKLAGYDHKDKEGKPKGRTEYKYPELAEILETTKEASDRNGFSHDWKTKYEADYIYITCFWSHVSGHFETDTIRAKADFSGGKTPIHADASTISYLRRYAYMGVAGLSASGEDNDAHIDPPSPYTGDDNTWRPPVILQHPTPQQMLDVTTKVSRGEMTIEDVERIYHLTESQFESLKIASGQ